MEQRPPPSKAAPLTSRAIEILDLLPDTLEYTGEFGAELILFVPYCHWLSKAGLLKTRRIITYRGMNCYYDNIDCLEIVFKDERRRFIPAEHRLPYLPIKNEHDFHGLGRSPFHFFSDQRKKFAHIESIPDIDNPPKPLLVVHNKYNDEWNVGPVNFISLDLLDHIFDKFRVEFTTVYIRHGIKPLNIEFSEDHNGVLPFDDQSVLDRHPHVVCFDRLFEQHRAEGGPHDINTFKNILYSRCYHFISSQGGGAHQIAQFSGSILIVLHRRGADEIWAYGDGYYGFMAPVPPIRAICRTENDLRRALELLQSPAIAGGRALMSGAHATLLEAFSPWTIARRRSDDDR